MNLLWNKFFKKKRHAHIPLSEEQKKRRKAKKKIFVEIIFKWLDVILLLPGMFFVVYGSFLEFGYIGYIILGGCLVALAFFVASKQAKSSGERR